MYRESTGPIHQQNLGNAANHSTERRFQKRSILRISFWQIILLWAVFPPGSFATEFSTTNREELAHFWSAIESSNRPVTIVSFGDSMAESYRTASYHLMLKLEGRFGNAGYSLGTYRNTALWNVGTVTRGPDYFWFTTYFQLPASGAIWWENHLSSGGTFCDQAGIYYVSQTNGGQFRLLLSTNGGPWTPALTLNGYSTTPLGHFTNVALPSNRYRIRVEGDTGTNYIIGTSFVATHSKGIHVAFTAHPGIGLNQVTNVPRSIRDPIFAALQPDLILWHMKEALAGLPQQMAECEQWWTSSAPNCDVIYIGTPWAAVDTNTTTTPDQNTLIKNIALQHHRTYADLMWPTVSYPWLLTNGYMADVVHLNDAGGIHCANIMWDDLGFFALGLNRRLALQQAGNQLQLSYSTSVGARYRLETSTNLQNWSAILTNPVATTTFTTNFPASPGPTYYRLGLTPP